MADEPSFSDRLTQAELDNGKLRLKISDLEVREHMGILSSEKELRTWAREINRWARESKEFGWSTHQVEANRRLAGEIHDAADVIADERERLLAEVWSSKGDES